jgi:hypothetical protein
MEIIRAKDLGVGWGQTLEIGALEIRGPVRRWRLGGQALEMGRLGVRRWRLGDQALETRAARV